MVDKHRNSRDFMIVNFGIGAIIGAPLGFSLVPICAFIFQVIIMIISLPKIIAVASSGIPDITNWNVFFSLLDKHIERTDKDSKPSVDISQIVLVSKFAFYGAFMQIFGAAFLSESSAMVYAVVAYVGTLFVMWNFRFVRRWAWSFDIDTQYVVSNKIVQFMEFPSLEMQYMPVKAAVKLLSCPPDADQAVIASAISERRASLYLVSADAVIPVCYNPEENDRAIGQLRTDTFQRDIPVVALEENPMPEPASGIVLAWWSVGLLVGFYFGLGQLYHLAHSNPQVTKQILPLISFICTWGALEVYSLVLRRRGYAKIRKAVGM